MNTQPRAGTRERLNRPDSVGEGLWAAVRALARRAVFSSPVLGATVATLALSAALGCAPREGPGLGEIMSLQQMRHAKLWYAGEAGNWELAGYELDELEEGFADVVKYHPTHKDSPVALSQLVPGLTAAPLGRLREAVAAHDATAFAASFDALTAACNACHRTARFGFNVVRRPQGAGWYANQDFAPSP